jgi:hypothetical protein
MAVAHTLYEETSAKWSTVFQIVCRPKSSRIVFSVARDMWASQLAGEQNVGRDMQSSSCRNDSLITRSALLITQGRTKPR